jgi:hypothetical protein
MNEDSLNSGQELKRAMFWKAWLAGWICGVTGMSVAFYALGWLFRWVGEYINR